MKYLFFLLLMVSPVSLLAVTYTVTMTTDSPTPVPGQLRWAINQSNSSTTVIDNIVFNIPGTAPHVIQLQSTLTITNQVSIFGDTQPANGYTGIEPKISIKGTAGMTLVSDVSGNCVFQDLTFFNGANLLVLEENGCCNIVERCVFYNANVCLKILQKSNKVKGCYFGTDHTLSTTIAPGSNHSIVLDAQAANNQIGGLGAGDMNYFYNMPSATSPLEIKADRYNKISGNLFVNNAKNIRLTNNGTFCGNLCKATPVFTVTPSGSTYTLTGTSDPNDVVEVFLTNNTGIDAVQFLGSVTANGSGAWTMTLSGLLPGSRMVATATNTLGSTSEFSVASQGGIPCENCVNSFSPAPGEYIVSAWVKEAAGGPTTVTYANAKINITFTGSATTYNLVGAGKIIDGWQRIEQKITIPSGVTDVTLKLQSTSGEVYFDDIRFFPVKGSMKSYVYDPVTMRLMAELDERNYAIFYEYDEEGKLIRKKMETEKGVMTTGEYRESLRDQ